MITEEQAAGKRGSWGCTDQLLVNKMIYKEVTGNRRNLITVWLDYRKAFDSVLPHDWVIKSLQTCQCKESKFCYEPHGHVITGDLRVIENAKLRELVAKGPKYREPNRVNWKATETMFLESIDLYAKNWSKREQVELKISLNGKTS